MLGSRRNIFAPCSSAVSRDVLKITITLLTRTFRMTVHHRCHCRDSLLGIHSGLKIEHRALLADAIVAVVVGRFNVTTRTYDAYAYIYIYILYISY